MRYRPDVFCVLFTKPLISILFILQVMSFLGNYEHWATVNDGVYTVYDQKYRNGRTKEDLLQVVRKKAPPDVVAMVKVGRTFDKQVVVVGTPSCILRGFVSGRKERHSRGDFYYRNDKSRSPVRFFLDLDPVLPGVLTSAEDVRAAETRFDSYLALLVSSIQDIVARTSDLPDDTTVFVDRQIRGGYKCSAHIIWNGCNVASSLVLKRYLQLHQ